MCMQARSCAIACRTKPYQVPSTQQLCCSTLSAATPFPENPAIWSCSSWTLSFICMTSFRRVCWSSRMAVKFVSTAAWNVSEEVLPPSKRTGPIGCCPIGVLICPGSVSSMAGREDGSGFSSLSEVKLPMCGLRLSFSSMWAILLLTKPRSSTMSLTVDMLPPRNWKTFSKNSENRKLGSSSVPSGDSKRTSSSFTKSFISMSWCLRIIAKSGLLIICWNSPL
mmetsp:Transcript_89689/g.253063  ORF Transcript_89689/g.253063 Transcript_89689/m.253063 type:complete len:223 (+) Transcript_89689:51-719(+)